jgi:hypothetical protein
LGDVLAAAPPGGALAGGTGAADAHFGISENGGRLVVGLLSGLIAGMMRDGCAGAGMMYR